MNGGVRAARGEPARCVRTPVISEAPMLPYLPLAAFVLTFLCCCAYGEPRLVVCCDAYNDLPAALLGAGDVVVHVDSPEAALEVAATGDAVLVLADGYPEATTALPEGLFEQARARDLRLYVETRLLSPAWMCPLRRARSGSAAWWPRTSSAAALPACRYWRFMTAATYRVAGGPPSPRGRSRRRV